MKLTDAAIADTLVSVIVITYNSHETVVDTLESIRKQTYDNIELVISDDSSTDDTVDICRSWLNENRNRFSRSQIVTAPINTGIAANCNRGLYTATGKWVKLIAGDDILLPNCLIDNFNFVQSNSEILFCHSRADVYLNSFAKENFIRTDPKQLTFTIDDLTAKEQTAILKLITPINAPSFFANRVAFMKIGGYDQSTSIEDWPTWLKITTAGHKIWFLNRTTVGYRLRHKSSIFDRQKKVEFVKRQLWDQLTLSEKCYYKYDFLRLEILQYFTPTNWFGRFLERVINVPIKAFIYSKNLKIKRKYNKQTQL